MIMKKLLLVLILVSGCNSINSDMRSWIGSSADELVDAWGPPSEQRPQPEGGYAYSWNETRHTDGGSVRNVCNRRFVTDANGKIISYSYVGCKRFLRD